MTAKSWEVDKFMDEYAEIPDDPNGHYNLAMVPILLKKAQIELKSKRPKKTQVYY
jgi:hypothetical protein